MSETRKIGSVVSNSKIHHYKELYKRNDRTLPQIAWVNGWVCPKDFFI
jgi:hypothetical protein